MSFDDYNRHSADGGLWDRFTNAISGGGIFRTLIRLIALFSALIILGLNKIQCSLNYMGNNDLSKWEVIKLFFGAMKYGYERASIMLWHELENFTVENLKNNWGDMLVLLMFIVFVFTALYSFVSIISDFFDGDVKDKAPKYLKVIITLALMLVFSASMYYFQDKPSDNFYVNSGLLLTNSEKEICKLTGEVEFFISEDTMSGEIINNNIIQNSTDNNINNNISISQIENITNENSEKDKSVELINMLNE